VKQQRMKGKRAHPHIGLILKVISLKLFLNHSWFRKSEEGLERANPVARILLTWTDQAALHAFYILHENIQTTRVVTLSAGELGTMSKNNLRGITLVKRPIWGMNSLTLHPLLLERDYLGNKAYMGD